MTAVWRSGAELAPHTTLTEFTGGAITNASQDMTIRRSGASSLKFSGPGHTGSRRGLNLNGAAARIYWRLDGTPTTASPILGFWSPTEATPVRLDLRADRKLELHRNTLLATSAFTLPIGSFQCLELWYDRTTNVASSRYNGIEWARATVTPFSEMIDAIWVGPVSGLGCAVQIDDLGINSFAGDFNNGWCGPSGGGVLTYLPIPGTQDLTPAWSIVGAASAGEALDESVPNDGTDFLREEGTPGAAVGFRVASWDRRTPASAVLFGGRGWGGLTRLQWHDAADSALVGPNYNWNAMGTWMTIYPILTVEQAWDGTRRMIGEKYLRPSEHPGLFAKGNEARVIFVRGGGSLILMTTCWMTVDFPFADPVRPGPLAASPQPAILGTINP